MRKKMIQIGKKTGLEVNDVNNLAKIGISGLLALTLSVLTAAWSNVSAKESDPQPKTNNDKTLPEKCRMVPEKSTCTENNTTYYYDSEKNECIEVTGCVTTVFDSRRECKWACDDSYTSSSTSKYGIYFRGDFKDAK